MSYNEASNQKTCARIPRYKCQVLRAFIWIPGSHFEKSIDTGQKEIDVTFEKNCIFIEK